MEEDDDEVNRLLRELGMDLPEVGDDPDAPPSLDELDENDRERTPRDWRAEWERGWDEQT